MPPNTFHKRFSMHTESTAVATMQSNVCTCTGQALLYVDIAFCHRLTHGSDLLPVSLTGACVH